MIIIFAVIVALLGGLIWAGTRSNSDEMTGDELTFSRVEENITRGAILYDVRTPAEYAEGHFADAINFDVEKMIDGEFPDTAKDTQLYVYCRSGNRSAQATSLLKDAGFTNVTDLGGLADVQAIGGQLVTD